MKKEASGIKEERQEGSSAATDLFKDYFESIGKGDNTADAIKAYFEISNLNSNIQNANIALNTLRDKKKGLS